MLVLDAELAVSGCGYYMEVGCGALVRGTSTFSSVLNIIKLFTINKLLFYKQRQIDS